MSDDLVKQLRDDSGDWLTDLAADRIAVGLETVKILVTSAYKEGWSDGSEGIELNDAWGESLTRTTLAELKGQGNESPTL